MRSKGGEHPLADDLDVFYWDACILYEHLNKDQKNEPKACAVRQLAAQNKKRENRICTSTVTHI